MLGLSHCPTWQATRKMMVMMMMIMMMNWTRHIILHNDKRHKEHYFFLFFYCFPFMTLALSSSSLQHGLSLCSTLLNVRSRCKIGYPGSALFALSISVGPGIMILSRLGRRACRDKQVLKGISEIRGCL